MCIVARLYVAYLFAGTWLQKLMASRILLLLFYLARNSLIHRYIDIGVFDGNTSSPIPRPLLHGWESGNETPMQTTLC